MLFPNFDEAIFARAHRWRYSIAGTALSGGCLWDAGRRIGACGDWCSGSRVEGAFVSGMAIAGRILGLPDRVVPGEGGRAVEAAPALESFAPTV